LPAAPILFELGKLTLGYGRRAVLHVDTLTIRAGEFWCIIGPNAAGKTTLIRTLLGDLEPLGGTLLVHQGLAAPAHIGFVPQHCSLNRTLPTTVREFVALGMVGLRLRPADRAERLRWALAQVRLAGKERENYFRLSGGQRQRALVARALVRKPKLLILDEPTQELDTVAEQQILETVGELNAREGVTVMFVTHQLEIAARYATSVAFVRRGGVVSGTREQMLTPSSLAEAFGADPSFFENLDRVPRGVRTLTS
jgi:ABC-type Mn2+/Zn2+ transport system ATPase subunit